MKEVFPISVHSPPLFKSVWYLQKFVPLFDEVHENARI